MGNFFSKIFGNNVQEDVEDKNIKVKSSQLEETIQKVNANTENIGISQIMGDKPVTISDDINLMYFKSHPEIFCDIIEDYNKNNYTQIINIPNFNGLNEAYELVDLQLYEKTWVMRKKQTDGQFAFYRPTQDKQLMVFIIENTELGQVFQLENLKFLDNDNFIKLINKHIYECNLKKEHLLLENVKIFDEYDEDANDRDRYIPATIEVMGTSIRNTRYYSDFKSEFDPETGRNGISPDYSILNVINDEILEINIDYLEKIIIGKEAFESFLDYNRTVNYDFHRMITDFADKINKFTSNLLANNKEFRSIFENFITIMPIQFMKDPEEMCKLEMLLEFHNKNKASTLLLKSYEFERAKLRALEIVDFEEITATFKCDMGLTLDFYNEHIKYLVKVMVEQLGEDLIMRFMPGEACNVSYYVALIAINKTIKLNSSETWWSNNGSYFKDIEALNLEKSVERYFNIDTIDQDNQNTAGDFIYYLMDNHKFFDNENYFLCYGEFLTAYFQEKENQKYKNFKKKLTVKEEKKSEICIDDIDLMSGHEFEYYISNLFSNLGYRSEVTKKSGDQGIDVICEKNGKRLGIQTKCYAAAVGNSAIQEVVAGKSFYKLDKVMVITNSYFTKSAMELASSNEVILWDRSVLKEKLIF